MSGVVEVQIPLGECTDFYLYKNKYFYNLLLLLL